jgi:hypothetical protein
MGRIARAVGRVFSGAVKGFLGGGPLGAILGGVKGAFGKGGIAGLLNPIKMFGNLAKSVLGKLGGLGLGGLSRPPTQFGRIQMPYPRPSFGFRPIGGPRPGGSTVGGMSPAENKLLGRFGGLEAQQNRLLEKLNDPNLSQAEMAKIQQQLAKITNMMKQITSILSQINKTMSSIISNIRA